MEFPYTYFEDEIREGFYVSGIMKRLWAAQLEVLNTIDNICKKHNIKWFIEGGTLLGAVRHKGYIPWDDDLDISMLRDDYDRFNAIARAELPAKYFWMNYKNDEDPYYQHFSRITNGHEIEFDEKHLKKYHQFPYVVGVDIFPLDYLSDDEDEEENRKKLAKLAMIMAEAITPEGDNVKEYKEKLEVIEKQCKVKIDYKGNVKQQLFGIVEKLFTMFKDKPTENVAFMHSWVCDDKCKYPSRCYDELVMLPFEVTSLPAPTAYDEVLRIAFGDYMKLVKDGGDHNYPVFLKQESQLIDMLPEYHFKYSYSKEHLENPVRRSYVSPKLQVENFVDVMKRAHGLIMKNVYEGYYDGLEKIFISCQNGAIRIGTMLEDYYGEGFATVKYLEQYCEILYQAFEVIQESSQAEVKNSSFENVEEALQTILEDILISIENDTPKQKKVLFIGYKARAWTAFDNVWKDVNDDADTQVDVMPIPYYELDALGHSMNMHYEGEQYPEYLNLVDYRTYDIEKYHPDVIYIQNPYDECNYTTAIMSEFYSERLKGFTDKLVYIPWFSLSEFDEKDEKAKQTMNYFCKVPGVVHADVVMVQSENMRKKYIECLTELAGEDTRHIWESKIVINKYL